jgi:2-(1,2-epoxy-1,2-dihydrophenyl)acetyl-CoA isomerase
MPDLEEARDGAVVVLTLCRPERLNAFSDEMLTALGLALDRLASDLKVGAVVLTGAGRAFCVGGDLKAAAVERSPEQRLEILRQRHRIVLAVRQHPKPIIAMVNGAAYGAGLGLMLACDLRLGAASAKFGTAFVRMGLSGDFGTSYSLTRILGPTKARELMLLGEVLDAEQAHALGLLQRVLPDAELRNETMRLAQRIAAGPGVAQTYMKRNLLAAEAGTLAEVLELEAMHQTRAALTDDHAEAARAFAEKRQPVFRGR